MSVHRVRIIFYALLLALIAVSAFAFDRYFWMGSGNLFIKNLRNGEEVQLMLLRADRSFNETALAEADRVFGFPTKEKDEHISPRLLFMLSFFADQAAPGKPIMIESAYRSPEYNDAIRKQGANAARVSTHIDGMAVDFWIEGVDGKTLWEIIRNTNCCGVGHYGGKTIHLDAGRPRFWEAATSGTRSPEPDQNRHVYISTEYDRYQTGELMRFSISGASDFSFGIIPTIQVYPVNDLEHPITTMTFKNSDRTDCIMIGSRKASRFLYASMPHNLQDGQYRAKISFCNRPFEKMPSYIFSNVFEVLHP
jgi:uncharacterized protein YcbK (DUF882 family)